MTGEFDLIYCTALLATMPKVPVKNVKTIKIELYWEDDHSRGSNYFDNVQQFAQFLKDNPELAKAVGYVPKNRI
ncbi:MAG: hypothetical protein QY309_02420 [Cyclobacteriaceae bacterium]|nr:MAG: hypothetical protein QY309_02420 [Cyclobacteriaceae bacterium]